MKRILLLFLFTLTVRNYDIKDVCNNANRSSNPKTDSYITKNTGNYRNNIFSPVMIYRKTNIMNNIIFAGTGSLFESEKESYIITSEHLFDKNNPSAFYLYKNIFTKESGDIEEVVMDGYELTGKKIDIILLKTGRSKKIRGIYDGEKTERAKIEFTDEVNPKMLKSLVSGKNIKTLGKASIYKNDEIEYLVIDYSSIKGESGTGFIDEKNNLYVLKGTIEDRGKKVTIVYGPLSF